MPGSSNFLPFNPAANNQESDAAYLADSLRSDGAANSALLPAVTFNKLMYQQSTFVAALGQALANKGYTLSDANLGTLTATLQNLMSAADMGPYALLNGPVFTNPSTGSTPGQDQANSAIPNTYWVDQFFAKLAYVNATFLSIANAAATYATNAYVNGTFAPNASPALTGNPTAPTQAGGDNSTRLASTAFVKNQNYQPALGFKPVQQDGGTGMLGNKLYLGWDGGGLRLQVDNNDTIGRIALQNAFPSSIGSSYGYSRMTNGQLLQWGTTGTASNYSAGTLLSTNYPVSFASNPCIVTQLSNAGIAADSAVINVTGTNTGFFNWACTQNSSHAIFWIAIGS